MVLLKITTGKGISCIYKYDQQNWPYTYINTNFVIPKRSDISIKTQCNSASDASVDAHDGSSAELYQSTNHLCNTDVNNNDDSQSFETPRENNCNSSSFGDTITTITTPCSSKLTPPGNNICVFKLKVRVPIQNNVLNQEH